MSRYISLFLLFFLLVFNAHSQWTNKFDIGLGMGIDYGGFGQRITFIPNKNIGIFGSLGYNLVGLGYNAGVQLRLPIDSRITGYLTAMYGYNATIKVNGYAKEGEYIYYGPSIGNGWIWIISKKKNLSLNLELILPFRPQAFEDAVNDFNMLGNNSMSGYYDVGNPSKILFSLGIHYRVSSKDN